MNILAKDPLWYKQAVIYEIYLRGFYDKNNDGIGDFAGLIEKLDYLEALGITAIWVLPFYPSPLKDDGYDISNYLAINPSYGTLKQFKLLLKEAHRRNIRVITELVINHTSDQHPWVQRARLAKKGSAWRDFYVWTDNPDSFKEARIIFQDFETSNWSWDPVAKAYYWHRFYANQPDLNFNSLLVQKEVFRALDFWFEMGVDGLRLDAIPYLYEQEGSNCENLPATHAFIKKLRQHVDTKFKDKALIAEANQWPEDAVAYFGNADECHMAFNFPVMPRLFMAIQMEDKFPIVDILEQTPNLPASCQWLTFLRNHDELTLEMVSDEERDYMYRIYAKDPKARINLGIRRRLAPLLDNDRLKIELMNILLLSLPGTPVIYYGDEIGMGDNYYLGDRNGVRTPMQWTSDKNAGFSEANPQQLFLPMIIDPPYHYHVVNVENQERNPSSLLWWMRRVLNIYKQHKSLGYGNLEMISCDNPKVLAFTRTHEEETLLVIVNLSRFPQAAYLDLSKYAGYIPKVLFHHNSFPKIKEEHYSITLGPYNYYWLSLQMSQAQAQLTEQSTLPTLVVSKGWNQILSGHSKEVLENDLLPKFISKARWFANKARSIQSVSLKANMRFGNAQICLVNIHYHEIENPDTYLLALSFALDSEADQLRQTCPQGLIAYLTVDDKIGILCDGFYTEEFRQNLLNFILHKKKVRMQGQTLVALQGSFLKTHSSKNAAESSHTALTSQMISKEQSNSACLYGNAYYLKFYRRLEPGSHIEIEMQRFLTDQNRFTHTPAYIGSLEWHTSDGQSYALAMLAKQIESQATGWTLAIDALTRYYEEVLALKEPEEELHKIKSLPDLADSHPFKAQLEDMMGLLFLEAMHLLGERTAQMHIALGTHASPANSAFEPEGFSQLFQRSFYQSMRRNTRKVFQLFKEKSPGMSDEMQKLSAEISKSESKILDFVGQILKKKFALYRIRIHGDYHLGQVLHTGKDFQIIDFEGEPLKSMNVRRIKSSPLQDVAGMLRSFHYAAYYALQSHKAINPTKIGQLEPWADLWYRHVCARFTEAYRSCMAKSPLPLIPQDKVDWDYLLQIFILEKVIYELGYELSMRPEWVSIPCKGILYNTQQNPTHA